MNSRFLLYISAIILVLPVLFSPQYLNESTPRFGPDDDDDSDGVINSEDRYPNATVVLEMLDLPALGVQNLRTKHHTCHGIGSDAMV